MALNKASRARALMRGHAARVRGCLFGYLALPQGHCSRCTLANALTYRDIVHVFALLPRGAPRPPESDRSIDRSIGRSYFKGEIKDERNEMLAELCR